MRRRKKLATQHNGEFGEDVAAEYLRDNKFKILHRNYKTTRYEIDIIAQRKRRLYFVEVKYRSGPQSGRGYEYVTQAKLRQMAYAAESWVTEHNEHKPYQLVVISVDGDEVKLIDDIWF